MIVLIDTWWNVNTNKIMWCDSAEPVLIDTWWNVNNFADASASAADGF